MSRLHRRILHISAYILICSLFLVSCSSIPQQNISETPVEKPQQPAEVQEESTTVPVITSCEPDTKSPDEKGTIILKYNNGQQEKLSDYCIEKDEPAFQVFKVIYYCEGTESKTRIYSCKNNMTCFKGACS